MFDFFFFSIFSGRLQILVHSEDKIGKVDLIPSLLFIDDLFVVKNLHLKVSQQSQFTHGCSILHQSNVNCCIRMLRHGGKYLLFKDDPVLEWYIGISVLNRFATDYLSQIKALLIA